MPPLGLLLGRVDFRELFIDLSRGGYPTLAAATAAGAPIIRYGLFLNTLISFMLVAFAVFLLVKQVNRLLGAIRREGVTVVPLAIYFNERGRAKVELGLAHGKKKADKRQAERDRDWQRSRARLLRSRDL